MPKYKRAIKYTRPIHTEVLQGCKREQEQAVYWPTAPLTYCQVKNAELKIYLRILFYQVKKGLKENRHICSFTKRMQKEKPSQLPSNLLKCRGHERRERLGSHHISQETKEKQLTALWDGRQDSRAKTLLRSKGTLSMVF